MIETLTKENFWDEIEQKYPKAVKHFNEWIDKYKSKHDWDNLFNDPKTLHPDASIFVSDAPKYHELPVAMQFGIFVEYIQQLAAKTLKTGLSLNLNRLESFEYCVRVMIDEGLDQWETRL